MVESTTTVNKSSLDVRGKMEEIISSITSLKDISADIAYGMDEMNTGIGEVFKTFTQITESTTENAKSVTSIDDLVSRFQLSH